MKELLNEIDELLTHLEDYIHGKDGDDITEMRYKIRKALRQPDVIKSVCDHRYHSRNGRYMLYEDWCEKCGTDISQTVL